MSTALATLASVGHEIKAIARAVPKLSAPPNMFAPSYGGLGGSLSPYTAGLQMLDGGGHTAMLDYDSIVGSALNNAVVARCADARAKATADAPLLLEERTPDGWRLQNDHECLGPLRAPNPDHSDADVWGLTEVWKSVEAQSYWLVLPNRMGKPGEIHVWNPARVQVLGTSDQFISGYRVQKETGEYAEVDKRLIIHFRHLPNPFNPRVGWNPLGAGRMQIAGDNLSATYHTAILRNAGVISMLISLKEGVTAGSQVTADQFEKVLNHIRRATIENAGGVQGLNVPLDIHKMAYSPAEMSIDKLIEYYERRICSVMGVSQRVAGLGADPTYCLPAGARVWSPSGPIEIQNVKTGNIVWSFVDNRLEPRRVVKSCCTGIKQIFEIRTKNRVLRATGNHPVLVRKAGSLGGGDNDARRVGFEWKRVDELTLKDHLVQAKSVPDQGGELLPNGEFATPEMMQFLGAIVGDGTVKTEYSSHVVMSIPVEDRIASEYREMAQRLFTKQEWVNGELKRVPVGICEQERCFSFSSAQDCKTLVEFGFGGRAKTKRVPGWVFGLTRELRLAFVAGIIDTDGTIDKRGCMTLALCNRELIEDVRDLIISCGIQSSNVSHLVLSGDCLPQKGLHETYEQWKFTLSSAQQVAEFPFVDTLYRERVEANTQRGRAVGFDSEKAGLSEDLGFFNIKSITPLHAEPVFDIEVEGGHSFIAEGVVVHNSNLEQALKDFWNRTIVPSRNSDAATLNRQWLPLWGMDSTQWRFRFDYSNVPALQENKDGLHTRAREDYKAGAMDLMQYRALVGYAGKAEDEEKYRGVWTKQVPDDGAPDAEPAEAKIARIHQQIARADAAQGAI